MTTGTSSRMQRRRAFFRRLHWYGYASGCFLVLVGLAYLLIGSPLFKVSELDVVGANQQTKEALLATLKGEVASGKNGWLGTDSYFAWPDRISYTTARVKNVAIEKSFFTRSVRITVTPRERYIVWCIADRDCYWADHEGVIFERAPLAEGQLVQTVRDDEHGLAKTLGMNVLSPAEFAVLTKIIEQARELGFASASLSIHRETSEVWLQTQGARILFSLRFDPAPSALPALVRFSKKPGLSTIDYLNLTVENRAFVKYK